MKVSWHTGWRCIAGEIRIRCSFVLSYRALTLPTHSTLQGDSNRVLILCFHHEHWNRNTKHVINLIKFRLQEMDILNQQRSYASKWNKQEDFSILTSIYSLFVQWFLITLGNWQLNAGTCLYRTSRIVRADATRFCTDIWIN